MNKHIKRIQAGFMFFVGSILLTSYACETPGPLPMVNTDSSQQPLIVYLSRTKNTEMLAKILQQEVGGELIAIETREPYPADYEQTVKQVAEENRTGYLPPLKTKIDSLDKYSTVFIGFPTWGMQLPPPMKSFLSEHNLEGKTVIPFNTNAGYGLGSCIETIRKLCTKSKILEAFSVEGGKEKEGILFVMEGEKEITVKKSVVAWLKKIQVYPQTKK